MYLWLRSGSTTKDSKGNEITWAEKLQKDTIELIQEEKRFLKHELTKIFGDQMKIFPSEANFLLLKTQIPLYRLLLERGILIRNCANYTGLGQDFYRIAVKGHPENVQLIEALLDIKKKGEEKREELRNLLWCYAFR
mgnify:CR=1 FL=1